MSPKVSIITPTHNRAELLKITIQSVLGCGYDNLEYIIIDDCSTDNTAEMVKEFAGKVVYVRNEQNLGESGSINRGWQLASGKYFATLSDDDFFLPNWFLESVSFMEKNPGLIAAYPDWNRVDVNGEFVSTVPMPEYDFVKLFCTCANMPGPGVIIRKEMLPGVMEIREAKYKYAADYILWMWLGSIAPFGHIKAITACWRQHPQSLTCNPDIIYKAGEMEQAIKLFVASNQHSPYVKANSSKLITRTYLHIVYALVRGSKYLVAVKYALRTLAISPVWACLLFWCYVSTKIKKIV